MIEEEVTDLFGKKKEGSMKMKINPSNPPSFSLSSPSPPSSCLHLLSFSVSRLQDKERSLFLFFFIFIFFHFHFLSFSFLSFSFFLFSFRWLAHRVNLFHSPPSLSFQVHVIRSRGKFEGRSVFLRGETGAKVKF